MIINKLTVISSKYLTLLLIFLTLYGLIFRATLYWDISVETGERYRGHNRVINKLCNIRRFRSSFSIIDSIVFDEKFYNWNKVFHD